MLITETDIFEREKKNRKKSEYSGQKIQNFADLPIGDYVVHESHGLGIYRGIEKIEMDRVTRDYMKIEYAGGSNLYVLATQLDTLQKYASGEAAKVPKLNKIGGQEWNKTKTRVRHAVKISTGSREAVCRAAGVIRLSVRKGYDLAEGI